MKISVEQLAQLLSKNWYIASEKLNKVYTFKNYEELTIFTNKVFEIAQKQNHHPELLIKYNSVEVSNNNHDEKNISNKCNNFANAIDLINFSPSI